MQVVSVYDSPFWRNGSGIEEAVTAVIDPDPALPVREGWDISPPGGPGVIASFMYPDHAFDLLEAVSPGRPGHPLLASRMRVVRS